MVVAPELRPNPPRGLKRLRDEPSVQVPPVERGYRNQVCPQNTVGGGRALEPRIESVQHAQRPMAQCARDLRSLETWAGDVGYTSLAAAKERDPEVRPA